MNKITSTLEKSILHSNTIERNSAVIVGFSGGPDSLSLLHLISRLKEALNLEIHPVHVNHKLRANADREQLHAEEICSELGLTCRTFVIDCKALAQELKVSHEEAGRAARYDAFDRVADEIRQADPSKSITIALAHNADDQSETVLHRIIRGTGIQGLKGMSALRTQNKEYQIASLRLVTAESEPGCDNAYRIARPLHDVTEGEHTRKTTYKIARPLLNVTRAEIEKYIEENALVPNIDESNESTEYTRNKIRLELIPYIEQNFNPNFKEALRNLADIAATDDAYMSEVAAESYASIVSPGQKTRLPLTDSPRSSEALVDATGARSSDGYLDTTPRSSDDTSVATSARSSDDSESLVIDITRARELNPAILRRVIAMILGRFGFDQEASYAHIMSVMNLVMSDNPSARIDLPSGVRARREYARLYFDRESEGGHGELPELSIMVIKRTIGAPQVDFENSGAGASAMTRGDFENSGMGAPAMTRDDFENSGTAALEVKVGGEKLHAAFDLDKMEEAYAGSLPEIQVRTRRKGDRIAIKGGRKKIQDYFVDAKIPAGHRDEVPLVAIGGEILWVLPFGNDAPQSGSDNGETSRSCQSEGTRRSDEHTENVSYNRQGNDAHQSDKYKGKISHNYQIDEATERVLFLEIAKKL